MIVATWMWQQAPNDGQIRVGINIGHDVVVGGGARGDSMHDTSGGRLRSGMGALGWEEDESRERFYLTDKWDPCVTVVIVVKILIPFSSLQPNNI
jgi:hypothetical protein